MPAHASRRPLRSDFVFTTTVAVVYAAIVLGIMLSPVAEPPAIV